MGRKWAVGRENDEKWVVSGYKQLEVVENSQKWLKTVKKRAK